MIQGYFDVVANRAIAKNTYEMKLAGDCSAIARPGQFLNIKIEGVYLRRPMSVCDVEEGEITVIFKVVGRGTEILSRAEPGTRLDILTGLGNGFDLGKAPKGALLVGGGAGVPPLYLAAKKLIAAGKTPVMIMGFNEKSEIFYREKFEELGIEVRVTACDGSAGCVVGFVTDAMYEKTPYVLACGPEAMLKAVYRKAGDGQFSFEERMGCGFGACLVCSCKTKYGAKRICKDGPVLEWGEIAW